MNDPLNSTPATPPADVPPPAAPAAAAPVPPAGRPSWRAHVYVIVALVVLTGLIQVYAFCYVGSHAARWIPGTTPVVPTHYPGPAASDTAVVERQKRLLAQLDLAKRRETMTYNLAVHFLQNYYMAIVVSMAMGAVAAIALLAITGRGWAAAHPLAKTTFVAATSLATFFGAFQTVFKQSENFEANLASYRGHAALENEILTYMVTRLKADGKAAELEQFLVHVDGELAKLHQLAIAMDPGKMPSYSFATE